MNVAKPERGRTLTVSKYRGSGFQEGCSAMRITERGILVYPRLLPEAHHQAFTPEPIPCGIAELDELMHGGMERGTVTLITGPSGVGKTTLAMHFVHEAANRGERHRSSKGSRCLPPPIYNARLVALGAAHKIAMRELTWYTIE